MEWIWYFYLYSFLGFLLELIYARAVGARKLDRKCHFFLPVCPVYGLGGTAIALLPDFIARSPLLLFFASAALASGAEYGTALFYEKVWRVSFWDYHGQLGNLNGRVCLPFTLAWGLLLLPMVYWVHPAAARLFAMIPPPVSWAALAAFTADWIVSSVILRRTGDRTRLRWRRAVRRPQ